MFEGVVDAFSDEASEADFAAGNCGGNVKADSHSATASGVDFLTLQALIVLSRWALQGRRCFSLWLAFYPVVIMEGLLVVVFALLGTSLRCFLIIC